MVRLKALKHCGNRIIMFVSIPYGTIKSECCALKHLDAKHVSIPYGTIKRLYVPSWEPYIVVSIPYGTIKSQVRHAAFFRQRLFQFLMVRLKEHAAMVVKAINEFQFLMVRLKVDSLCNGKCLPIRFNSLWYD